MRYGLGIDTGGTYTDAVIYDFSLKKVLHSAKSLTTKDNLSIGIVSVLNLLPYEELKKVELVSLSTTLATNACVEEKGGRAKLIFIDADESIIKETGYSYGLPPNDEIYFLNGKINFKGEVLTEPDWNLFLDSSKEWISTIDAAAVVQHLGVYNPVFEKMTKELLQSNYGIETVCGHELFSDLNYIKRGASCLLNAKLIPLISDFLENIKKSLSKLNISAPVVIVRSDGSLMSEAITKEKPVETLLCGPAASVMGGINLTNEDNCIVIDMGGTTTDIALVTDKIPHKAEKGVNVGKWRTFVKSVYIDTFGLGGDSHISMSGDGKLLLGPKRVIPVSYAAMQWPDITEELKKITEEDPLSIFPLTEYLTLVKDISNNDYYDESEKKICNILKSRPYNINDLAEHLGTSPYNIKIARMEQHGIIMRIGLTPTDIMHIKGDFNKFNQEASFWAGTYMAHKFSADLSSFCEMVYDKVKKDMYSNIVRVILQKDNDELHTQGIDKQLLSVISKGYEKKPGDISSVFFKTDYTLIGIGAPIHIFLPDVAKAMGARYVVPENANVANAVGAVVGNVITRSDIKILPEYSASGITGYIVFTPEENFTFKDYDEALSKAIEAAKKYVYNEALHRGARGDIVVKTDIKCNTGDFVTDTKKGSIHLDTVVTAYAVGKPSF